MRTFEPFARSQSCVQWSVAPSCVHVCACDVSPMIATMMRSPSLKEGRVTSELVWSAGWMVPVSVTVGKVTAYLRGR